MKNNLPHDGVYARLYCSPIHGVGVVAIRDIKRNTLIFKGDDADLVWLEKRQIIDLPIKIRKLYDDFAVIKGDRFGCPVNFNRMTPAWYLNEPKPGEPPNVGANEEYEFFALRDIRKGEELTVRYCTFSDEPS